MDGRKDTQPGPGRRREGYTFDIIVFTGLEENNFVDVDRVQENEKDQKKAVDVVPGFWVTYDKNLKSLITPFPPPPYNTSITRELHKLVQSCSPPLDIWPEYSVELRGGADTYSEAVKRVKQLSSQEYAYTTDVEHNPEERALEDAKSKQFKAHRLKVDLDKQDYLMSSAPKLPKKKYLTENISFSIRNVDPLQDPLEDNILLNSERASRRNHATSSGTSPIKKNASSKNASSQGVPKSDSKKTENILHSNKNSDSELLKSITSEDATNYSSYSQTNSPKKNKRIRKRKSHSELARNRSSNDSQTTDSEATSSPIKKPRKQTAESSGYEKHKKPAKPINPKGFTDRNVSRKIDASPDRDKTLQKKKSKENYSKSEKNNFADIDRHVFNSEVPKEERENPVLLFERILKAICSLRLEQKELRKQIACLGTGKPNSTNLIGCLAEDLAEKYDLELPVKTSQEFKNMDDMIINDKAFRKEFKESLLQLIDKENLARSLKNMLHKYIARDVILGYTAQKKMKNKLIFKDTEFCKVMKVIFFSKYNTKADIGLTETKFYQCLGDTISNAVDWDGFRALRKTKENKVAHGTNDTLSP